MPDPRHVGLHELRALIDRLNEANLRVTSAMAHLSLLVPQQNLDFDELISIKQVIEEDLLPRCAELLEKLDAATFEN